MNRASELGILSKSNPRLVTTLFVREVPRGTNGGMSLEGTIASAAGGLFIGSIFWLLSIAYPNASTSQFPMVIVGMACGLIGSLYDSILGATLQATFYSMERKCIIKHRDRHVALADNSITRICGFDILSNEAVNLVSILMTMLSVIYIGPTVFCMFDSSQCY